MDHGLSEMELELEGLGEFEAEDESELEDEFESELEDELEGESEFESELESELELEDELEAEGPNPVNKIYPDAMMEHLGRAAMNAESEDEAAEHFLPLIPLVASKLLPLAARALPKLAGKVLPRVARAITRATPGLTRNISHLTRTLHRNPHTRQLVRVMPSVARRAVTTIAKRTAAGHHTSPRQAAHILAREHRRVIHNPKILRSVLHRSKLMDHRHHRLNGYRHGPHGYRTGRAPMRGTGGYAATGFKGATGWRSAAGACPTCGARRGVRRACCCC
jgi:hypothetical protein